MKDFKEWLLENRKEKNLTLFLDLETLQFNEEEGRKKPSLYKNVTYSVGVGYLDNESNIKILIIPSLLHLFNTIILTYKNWKIKPTFEIIAHNNNKYDNHFIKKGLLQFYKGIKVENLFLLNATDMGNKLAIREREVSKEDKKNGIILEKRIKSSNNLELIFYLDNIKFYTTDNIMKTNSSIKMLGKKLQRLGLATEDELKTDYNYTQYNLDEDMTDEQSIRYAEKVFYNLDEDELKYIRNDIILLAKSKLNYSKIFEGFDYNKITFTSNILEHYNNNDLTNFQLLRKFKQEGKSEIHLKYTDYHIGEQNLYDYLKKCYNGGLNFYNTKFIGEVLFDLFSLDINSSYPYAMHNFKVPTFYHKSESFTKLKKIKVDFTNDNYFTVYEMNKIKFDSEIIEKIQSRVLRQIFVKYYGKHDRVYINDYTLRTIENITHLKIKELTVKSYITFKCYYFGSRQEISDAYYTKTQGSNKNLIEYNSPYDIKILNEVNKNKLTSQEVDLSKVFLNGLYGIPALRPYFNLFRTVGNEYVNIENGYKNSERNIIFSVFVTGVSLYNLLSPLQFLTYEEIDNNLVYTDTDSLYMFKRIFHKIPDEFLHPLHLGKWDIEHEHINKMYVLNHKKYAFEVDGEIKVKSGGIRTASFKKSRLEYKHRHIEKNKYINRKIKKVDKGLSKPYSFERFTEFQFKDGVEIESQKSIMNKDGTISIYPSTTKLELGGGYPIFAFDKDLDELRKEILRKAKEEITLDGDDTLYIESIVGTFSMADLSPVVNPIENTKHIDNLKIREKYIKRNLKLT